ncbi:hypothetical protein [Curtobacterium sp. Leaf261]|uniref:hypothetical protein n=1 Tax=Curtobacterium sp. Leaf261 TaxID=1736311 RepID=UPI000716304D|nr:hypothetical protein [Curtobacterium sp. Leaf261]KQO61380.1 hypothetical protein ASF23_12950 [Curtobacterium sp. Leaf261]
MHRIISKTIVAGTIAAAALATGAFGAGVANAAPNPELPTTFQSAVVWTGGVSSVGLLGSPDTSTGIAGSFTSFAPSDPLSSASTLTLPFPGRTGAITNAKGQCLVLGTYQYGNMVRPGQFPAWKDAANCKVFGQSAKWKVAKKDGNITTPAATGTATQLFSSGVRAQLSANSLRPTVDPRFQAALAAAKGN